MHPSFTGTNRSPNLPFDGRNGLLQNAEKNMGLSHFQNVARIFKRTMLKPPFLTLVTELTSFEFEACPLILRNLAIRKFKHVVSYCPSYVTNYSQGPSLEIPVNNNITSILN